jgi:hypothetical protein
VAADPSNRCQSAETCTRDINWIGHRTAPTVRVSSGGAGVLALASPRTIT